MTNEELDQLALEVYIEFDKLDDGSMTGSEYMTEFARRYRKALAEKMEPTAHIHRTNSNVIECIYKGTFCPADGHQLLGIDLPLNKSVALYSLEGWKK